MKRVWCLISLCASVSSGVFAQRWKVETVSVGIRVFEQSLLSNNPLTVASQLKEPLPYLDHLSTLPNSSLFGNPMIARVVNYYVGGQVKRVNTNGRFWKRHTIPLGIVWTNKNEYNNGAIGEVDWDPGGLGNTYKHYVLERNIQFLGLHTGLIRHFRLAENFFFVSGIQAQLSYTIRHSYRQFYDTTTFNPSTGRVRKLTEVDRLQGRRYLQWQVFIPVALEYRFMKGQLGLRVEADFGVVGNPIISNLSFADRESHGAGVSLHYGLGKRQQ